MTIIKAKEFSNRSELSNYINSSYGLTPEDKPEVVIRGSKDELARLHLSRDTNFWGIKCHEMKGNKVAEVKKSPQKPKINRGKIHKSKLK
jgi:hypothetical protein